jgi:hypothetical protein
MPRACGCNTAKASGGMLTITSKLFVRHVSSSYVLGPCSRSLLAAMQRFSYTSRFSQSRQATAMAERVAVELNSLDKGHVGYQIRCGSPSSGSP